MARRHRFKSTRLIVNARRRTGSRPFENIPATRAGMHRNPMSSGASPFRAFVEEHCHELSSALTRHIFSKGDASAFETVSPSASTDSTRIPVVYSISRLPICLPRMLFPGEFRSIHSMTVRCFATSIRSQNDARTTPRTVTVARRDPWRRRHVLHDLHMRRHCSLLTSRPADRVPGTANGRRRGAIAGRDQPSGRLAWNLEPPAPTGFETGTVRAIKMRAVRGITTPARFHLGAIYCALNDEQSTRDFVYDPVLRERLAASLTIGADDRHLSSGGISADFRQRGDGAPVQPTIRSSPCPDIAAPGVICRDRKSCRLAAGCIYLRQ